MIHDEISNPAHYDLFPDGMQAIDVIEAALTPEEFAGYLKGNFLKYRLRAGDKGPADKCLAKARWYQDYLRNIVAADAASQARLDWPSEQRRQDAEAEDEAVAAIQSYTGQGGVMIQCPGCVALSCECRP